MIGGVVQALTFGSSRPAWISSSSTVLVSVFGEMDLLDLLVDAEIARAVFFLLSGQVRNQLD